jgi:organic hydroperoxide reductase OsmC/OhrA
MVTAGKSMSALLTEACVENRRGHHAVTLSTNGAAHAIAIEPRASGYGSRANGGELLCLALATCYCNDIYREAEKRGIAVAQVSVVVRAEFGAAGDPAASISYQADVEANAPEADVRALMLHTDRVAEVQNTLRRGNEVRFAIGRVTASGQAAE